MNVELLTADNSNYDTVLNLSQYYIYDMSEYTGWPCSKIGQFTGCDEFFEDWRSGKNHPYIIQVDGELAGFTGIKYDAHLDEYEIQEFFILRKFRHRGVGRSIAFMIFDRYQGNWVVRQLSVNIPAVKFWQSVIDGYTNGKLINEGMSDTPWGMMQTLRFDNAC
ncbi:MAG: GNAT family N-acetyltransferase [Armatimonadota bacterium]